MKLPLQLWSAKPGGGSPHPELMEPIKDGMHWKPQGGLWTSTLNGNGSEWTHWMDVEQPNWRGPCWTLQPVEAEVLVIRNPAELQAIGEIYPRHLPEEIGSYTSHIFKDFLDWVKISKDFDAVWFPEPNEHRYSMESIFFNILDAESTIWFRWCFEDRIREWPQ